MNQRAKNASWLRIRFIGRLISQKPKSVLDVGAGLGQVLLGLRAAGIAAEGLESDPDSAAALAGQGLRVQGGTAEALPWETDAVDWVSIRHVLHHLADPQAALAEAVRVSRVGLLIAEPWRNLDVPGQDLGLALDRWMKRQDRRLGHEHHEDIAPAQIAKNLGELGSFRFEFETHLSQTGADLAEFESDLDRRLAGLGDDHPEREALGALQSQARGTEIGLTGSAFVVAHHSEGR